MLSSQNSKLFNKTSVIGSLASEQRFKLSLKDKEEALRELNSLPYYMKFQSTLTVLKYLEDEKKPTFIKNKAIFSKKHIMNVGVKNIPVLSPIKNPKNHDYFELSS